jgi:hypothetical protein
MPPPPIDVPASRSESVLLLPPVHQAGRRVTQHLQRGCQGGGGGGQMSVPSPGAGHMPSPGGGDGHRRPSGGFEKKSRFKKD